MGLKGALFGPLVVFNSVCNKTPLVTSVQNQIYSLVTHTILCFNWPR